MPPSLPGPRPKAVRLDRAPGNSAEPVSRGNQNAKMRGRRGGDHRVEHRQGNPPRARVRSKPTGEGSTYPAQRDLVAHRAIHCIALLRFWPRARKAPSRIRPTQAREGDDLLFRDVDRPLLPSPSILPENDEEERSVWRSGRSDERHSRRLYGKPLRHGALTGFVMPRRPSRHARTSYGGGGRGRTVQDRPTRVRRGGAGSRSRR